MANMSNRPEDYDYRQQNGWTENNEDRGRDWDGDRQMNFDRGRGGFERNREDYEWNYNQGGDGMGRGRRIWDQESGMYNQSPGYGRNTEAGRRGSEFYGGGSSYGGWGRGGNGQYDRGTFGGGYDRGNFDRGGFGGEYRGAGRYRDIPFENQQQYSDYMSRGGRFDQGGSGGGRYGRGADRFDEGSYFGGGRSGEGSFGAGNRRMEGMYSGGFGGYNTGMYGGRGGSGRDTYGDRGYGDEGWFHEDTGAGRMDRGVGSGFGRGEAGGWGRMNEGSGPHAGRGPRGYKRSDDRIREDVSEELERHGWVDASEIDVEVHDGEVTLKGSVDDRSQKRIAEDAAERVTGVKDVRNELRVNSRMLRENERGREHSTIETGHRNATSASIGTTAGNTHATVTKH